MAHWRPMHKPPALKCAGQYCTNAIMKMRNHPTEAASYPQDHAVHRNRILASAALAALVSLLLVSSTMAQGTDPAEAARREFVRAAQIAGTPLVENPADKPVDFNDAWDHALRIFQYRDWNIGNLELARAWLGIENEAQNCLLILQRISEIDRTKPPGIELLGKYLDASSSNATESQKMDATVTVLERLKMEADKTQLQQQFRNAEAKLYNSVGSLGDAGNSLSPNRISNAIAIDYWPSWRGVYAGDLFEAHNTSGGDVEYAAMVVTVHYASGNSLTHIHCIDRWPNGTWLAASYPYFGSDYAYARTFDDPQSVDAALYLPSGTATASYLLTQEEWGKILESYCSHLKFRGQFLGAYTDPQGQVQPPGFQFSFTGLSQLPAKSVEIRFWSSDGHSVGVDWTLSRALDPGTPHWFRSAYFQSGQPSFSSASPPAHITFLFRFAGTNYQLSLKLY